MKPWKKALFFVLPLSGLIHLVFIPVSLVILAFLYDRWIDDEE